MCTVLLPPGDNPIAVNKYITITIPKRKNQLYLINTNINESVLLVTKLSSSIENVSLSSPCRSLYKAIE